MRETELLAWFAGDSLLSPSVTRRVIDRMAQHPVGEVSFDERLDELTPREREVLEQVARGLPNGEIAKALVIEESTVKTYVKRILMKLRLRDRVQAVILAYESGLTRPGSKTPRDARTLRPRMLANGVQAGRWRTGGAVVGRSLDPHIQSPSTT